MEQKQRKKKYSEFSWTTLGNIVYCTVALSIIKIELI